MIERTDEQIVERVQAGEKDEFAVIIDRYERPLRAYAARITNNPEVVEDIVQDSFIKAYRDICSFDIKRKFSSWMYRIVHNESVSHIRRSKTFVQFEDIPEIADERNLAKEIEQKIDTKNDAVKLAEALSEIDPKYREAIYLRFFEDKDYDEIAEILRIPIGTVGTLIARGKQKLKEILKASK